MDVYLRSNANYKEVLMASSSVNNVNLSGTALPTPSDSSGSPGGSNGQLQFNNAGAFGGSATTTSANGELVFAGYAPGSTKTNTTNSFRGHFSRSTKIKGPVEPGPHALLNILRPA